MATNRIDGETAELTLYNWATSTCSQKVRLVLSEKSLSWKDHRIDPWADEHTSDWYRKLNPNGVVPTLLHGSKIIIDSSVINEYLDEMFPKVPLMPADAFGRARVRTWRQFIDEVPTAAIRIPSLNKRLVPLFAKMSEEEFQNALERRTIRRGLYERMGQRGFSEADIKESMDKLRLTVQRMEQSLGQSEWLAADQPTLADFSILPTIVRMEDLDLAEIWEDCERVKDWYRRCQRRPSFAAAYYQGARAGK